MTVRIGFTFGAFPKESEGQEFLRNLVGIGDNLGYDSIWLSDRIVGERFPLEPVVAMSMVAAYSDTLKFGTSVLALPLRNPVLMAKMFATLDYLSNGRLLPAVGLGQDDLAEYEVSGIAKTTRGDRLDESVALMRRLWMEDSVSHAGQFFTANNITIAPRTIQKPCPPIWIGGRSAAAQRRVGRVGDGWLVSEATPGEVEDGKRVIFATAAEHGRFVDAEHIGAMLGFYIAAQADEAATVAEQYVFRDRQEMDYRGYCALGTPGDVAGTLNKFVDAGASKFVLRPMCPPGETLEQLKLFGREILPLFHG